MERHLNADVVNEALVSLIVVRNLPFRMVEWAEFYTFCQTLNPRIKEFLITAHSTIPRLIHQSWISSQDIVRRKLQSAISNIHLSLDVWTSPNRLLFLGVCAHFVDQSQEKLYKVLIGLRTIRGHSGDEQLATLIPILTDYSILRKIGCIMGDNATTNDTLCRAFSIHLEQQEIIWDPIGRRLRCTGHIINLAVQAFLFQDYLEENELSSYDDDEDDIEKQRQTF
jgi:hypothetical protein